jgi:hypothetical protein
LDLVIAILLIKTVEFIHIELKLRKMFHKGDYIRYIETLDRLHGFKRFLFHLKYFFKNGEFYKYEETFCTAYVVNQRFKKHQFRDGDIFLVQQQHGGFLILTPYTKDIPFDSYLKHLWYKEEERFSILTEEDLNKIKREERKEKLINLMNMKYVNLNENQNTLQNERR